MLKIEIYDHTPANMLRAIRAACNELLDETHADLTTQAAIHVTRANELQTAADAEAHKAAAALSAHNLTAPTVAEMIQAGHLPTPTVTIVDEAHLEIPAPAAEETDSAGHAWNAELHVSTKAKNQDGTWKKRRGAGKAEDVTVLTADGLPSPEMVQKVLDKADAAPSLPPLPPAPPATPLVTMNDIYALVTNGKCVLNTVLSAAHGMGFRDLGSFSQEATPEQRAQLLAQLTKEVA